MYLLVVHSGRRMKEEYPTEKSYRILRVVSRFPSENADFKPVANDRGSAVGLMLSPILDVRPSRSSQS